jgi:hypothetical protein
MKSHRLTAALAVAALAIVSSSAKASVEPGFAGNTHPVFSATGAQGFIDFAVYDRTGGTVGDSFNTGIAGIDTALTAAGFNITSGFLYLFQNVNKDTDISQSTVAAVMANVTGHGQLTGDGFTGVTFASPTFNAAAAPGNPSPAVTGGTPTISTGSLTLVSPTAVTVGGTSVQATFGTNLDATNGQVSTLWGYTSNNAPVMPNNGSLQDNGTSAVGTVPSNSGGLTSVPEPSSLVVAGIGALGMLGFGLRRRKAQGA